MTSVKDKPQILSDKEMGLETRTSASQGGSTQSHCLRCGRPIQGRRRNGFCSDRCRMEARRESQQRRRIELLDAIDTALKELRQDLGVES
jgi:predicted nucleic acid-binding Zn ribbon protein